MIASLQATQDAVLELPTDKGHTTKVQVFKGERLCIYPPLVHHNAAIYSNPDKFVWDRFINHASNTLINPPGQLLQPFGAGSSMCPVYSIEVI